MFLVVITDGDVVVLELLLFLCQADVKLGDVLIWVPGTPLVIRQFFNVLFTKRVPVVFKMLNIVPWLHTLLGIHILLDLLIVALREETPLTRQAILMA